MVKNPLLKSEVMFLLLSCQFTYLLVASCMEINKFQTFNHSSHYKRAGAFAVGELRCATSVLLEVLQITPGVESSERTSIWHGALGFSLSQLIPGVSSCPRSVPVADGATYPRVVGALFGAGSTELGTVPIEREILRMNFLSASISVLKIFNS